MEVHKLGLVLVFLASALPNDAADLQALSDEAGVHCGNATLRPDHQEEQQQSKDPYRCVPCFFPQNCQANNTCRPGTTGKTCEQCQQHSEKQYRYHRVGSMCSVCPDIPWSIVSFGFYFLLFMCLGFFKGFSEAVCTKMKLLCHFVQYLLLTLHIKVEWPDNVVQFVSNTAFASFNTNLLNPECSFPSWPLMSEHYFEWLSSMGIPITVAVLGYFLDKSMEKFGKAEAETEGSETSLPRVPRRTTVRRLVFFVVVVMYVPAAVSCFRTYQCSNTVPTELVLDHSKNIFLLNNNESCETFTFQTIHFVATLYLVGVIVLGPWLIVFFTLRQKKWNLLHTHWNSYCPLYEAYKDRFCFWEAIPLLRKFVAVLITESYPFRPEVQIMVQLGMSAAYTVVIILLRPYRPTYWGHPLLNVHIIFEVASNLVVCFVQGVALTISLDSYQPGYGAGIIVLAGAVLIMWLSTVLAMSCETRQEVNQDEIPPSEQESEEKNTKKSPRRKFTLWRSRKVEQDAQFLERIAENKANINF